MIEKWKKSVDNGGVFGALLTDLSKTFDCISHDLTIAKLEPYGFHVDALKLIHDLFTTNVISKWAVQKQLRQLLMVCPLILAKQKFS